MTKTIVVIEDHLDTASYLAEKLPSFGYAATVARDGQAGLELLQAAPPAAVLLDLHLPVLTGAQVLARMRADERLQAVPVLLMTADPDAAQDLLEPGRTALIAKAATTKEIAARLDELIAAT